MIAVIAAACSGRCTNSIARLAGGSSCSSAKMSAVMPTAITGRNSRRRAR